MWVWIKFEQQFPIITTSDLSRIAPLGGRSAVAGNLLLLSNKKKDASCAHTSTATARPQLSQPYASKSLTHLIWTIPCWYDAAANLSIASKWFGGRYIDDIFVMMNRDDKMMYNFSLTTLQAVLSVHSNIRDFHIDYLYSDKVHIAWLLQW